MRVCFCYCLLIGGTLSGCGDTFSVEEGGARGGTDAGVGAESPGDGGFGGSGGASGAAATGGDDGFGGASGSVGSGGSTGGVGGAGTAGVSGSGGSEDPAACPTGRGPAMLAVDGYCVGTTEVTNVQYAEFLATDPDVVAQPSGCADNASYIPTALWDDAATDRPNNPVGHVDWCDAHAYCSWAGQRLCGSRKGGPVPTSAVTNAEYSEWHAACTRDGARSYPYGGVYDGLACQGKDRHGELIGGTVPVGSIGCEGGYDGLFDMSGNVWEWENACSAAGCYVRGGGYGSRENEMGCESNRSWGRLFHDPGLGSRCCADLR